MNCINCFCRKEGLIYVFILDLLFLLFYILVDIKLILLYNEGSKPIINSTNPIGNTSCKKWRIFYFL